MGVAGGVLWSLLLSIVRDDFRDVEDAFAWSLTLMIFAHVPVVGALWRRSGFDPRLGLVVGRRAGDDDDLDANPPGGVSR